MEINWQKKCQDANEMLKKYVEHTLFFVQQIVERDEKIKELEEQIRFLTGEE